MVWSFSFILFHRKGFILRERPGGKCEKVRKKSVEKYGKVRKSAETILPFSRCPLLFL